MGGTPAFSTTQQMSAPPTESPKFTLDTKNAYMLLLTKTDDSPIEDVLRGLPRGGATSGYHLAHEYYHRSTISGRNEASQRFYSATMESTGTSGWPTYRPTLNCWFKRALPLTMRPSFASS